MLEMGNHFPGTRKGTACSRPLAADLQLHCSHIYPGSTEAKTVPPRPPRIYRCGEMDAKGGKEGPAPSTQGRLDPRCCNSFNKKHLLSTHCQCARNRWTPGPVLFTTLAAPLLSLKFRLRPQLGGAGTFSFRRLGEESTGEEAGPSAAVAPPTWGPETQRGDRRNPGHSAHRWDRMGPGQLCPFCIFNK